MTLRTLALHKYWRRSQLLKNLIITLSASGSERGGEGGGDEQTEEREREREERLHFDQNYVKIKAPAFYQINERNDSGGGGEGVRNE